MQNEGADMKILILAPQPFFQNRGTPIATRMLAEDLQTDGHDIDLFVYHEGENIDLGNINLHRTLKLPWTSNINPGFSFKKIICDCCMLVQVILLCHRKKYDMVHAGEEAVFIAMIVKYIYKIRYIYDIDSWLSDQLLDKFSFLKPFRKFFHVFEKAAVKYSDGAIAVCKALEEKVAMIDPDKPVLRLEDVSLLVKSCHIRESLSNIVGNSDKVILYVGNLEGYQGIDLLLESFAIFAGRHSKASLIIIGGRQKDIDKYRSYATELAIGARVFFIGPRPIENLGMYLKQADLLVSPRINGENTPMKIYSYMASGIPIAATQILSHTQVLDDTNALLAKPTPESLANVFHKGLFEREKAKEISKRAEEIVESEYSRSAFKKKITRFYSEI